MKCLLIIIAFYVTLNSPIKAQDMGNADKLEEEIVQHGSVGIGTTIVQKKTVGYGEERIAYVKAKYTEQKAALENAIEEGEAIVIKAKEKIILAKERLEADKKKNRVSERVYIARKERLEMIAQKIKALEDNLMKY